MDANKVEKLKEIGYEIRPACGTCDWATFRDGSDFGSCGLHTYNHLKHDDDGMDLSVHLFGSCSEYEEPVILENVLGAWDQFVTRP